MKTPKTSKATAVKSAKTVTPKVSATPKVASTPKAAVVATPAVKPTEAKPTAPSFRPETMVGKLFSVLKDGVAHKPETLWNTYQSKSAYQILTDLRRAVKPFGMVVNRTETGSYQLVAPAKK